MYRIQADEQSCRILDGEDRVVFAGTFRECEEWLDVREQQRKLADRRASDSSSRISRIWSWIVRRLRRDETVQSTAVAAMNVLPETAGESRN